MRGCWVLCVPSAFHALCYSEPEDRDWWETENEFEYYKDEAKRKKAYAKCRAYLLAQVDSAHPPPTDDLLLDMGATAAKLPSTLALQNLALHNAAHALLLGHFERALCYLHALDRDSDYKDEHIPATHMRISYIYNIQGYRNLAAEHIRLAQGLLLPTSGSGYKTLEKQSLGDDARHRRFHDFLSFYYASTVLEDFRCAHLNGPQSAPALAAGVWDRWLKHLRPDEYDCVSVLMLELHLDILGEPESDSKTLAQLDDIVLALVRQSRVIDAFRVFIIRIEHSPPSWSNHLTFLTHLKKAAKLQPRGSNVHALTSEIAQAFTAEIELCYAKHLHTVSKNPKQRDKCLASSVQNYQKSKHAWGQHDVAAFRALLMDDNTADADTLLQTAIERLARAIDGFGEVNFPARQMNLLDSSLQILNLVNDTSTIHEVNKSLRDLYRATGRTAKFWVMHLLVMSVEAPISPDIGSFLEDCEQFPKEVLDAAAGGSNGHDDAGNLRILRLKVMFLVAHRTGDTPKTIEHGMAYIAALEAAGVRETASEATEMVAAALLVFDPESQSSPEEQQRQRENFAAARTLLTKWIAEDEASRRYDSEARKRLLIARGLVEFRSVLPPTVLKEVKEEFVDGMRDTAYDCKDIATFSIRHGIVEALYLEVVEGYESAIFFAEPVLQQWDARDPERLAFAELKMHTARRRILASPSITDETHKASFLRTAITQLTEAMDWYDIASQVGALLECRYWLGMAHFRLAALAPAVQILNFLFDDAPSTGSTNSAVGSLHKAIRQIFDLGLEVATAHDEAPGAWEWIQHSKARSLADMLKLHGSQVDRYPEIYFDDINWLYRDSPSIYIELNSLAPLFRMTRLSKALLTASLEDRSGIKAELRMLKRGMREDPALRGSLAVLTGAPATLDDLQWMSLTSTERVIFLDWTAVGDVLFLVHVEIVDARVFPPPVPGQRPTDVYPKIRMHKLGISVSVIERWRNSGVEGHRYLDRRQLSGPDAYDNLNMLKELIAPIKTLSQPGDMLVLCPTKPLHGIPLHAIEIDVDEDEESVVLLERNPVIYTYSHSVLRQCLARSKSHMKPNTARKAAYFGVYEGVKANDPEPGRVSAHLDALSTQFTSSVSWGDTVTKDEFKHCTAEATTIVHFHGHTLDHVVSLDQCLMLAQDERLSAQDIFALELRCAPLVTLIACASTDQTTMPGDEPLGILSAFLYSGAGSAIGTLWKTRSEDGRAWAREFYAGFDSDEGCRAGKVFGVDKEVRVVNLARCLRRAALAIKAREETNAPYHWAQFVLYGSWFGRG
ncbi:CHAT domain-containing protein [Hygrophoropsis aurantiaca]|uniref:CHAT domain-containing protein n=1 Tax=Hygrophoropsis aurantiaca TaxID=72124 RepID=A0ACB8A783_9AGAM|nr:CHAT domain-containing protein [Hygrophoropsis aurantiaca]